MKDHNYRPHHDWEGVDEVSIKVEPRFKTSGLSGDEWRVSAVVTFKRKGEVIYERVTHRMADAAKFLSWYLEVEMPDKTTFKRGIYGHFPEECAQPGCDKPSVNHYRVKELYTAQGDGPLPNGTSWEHRRAFCEAHSCRGDSDMEDNDKNYELIQGAGHKVIRPEDVSPSAFGGVI